MVQDEVRFMKKQFISVLVFLSAVLAVWGASAHEHKHKQERDGEHSDMSLESRKAQMLIRIEQRKQCVMNATSMDELGKCKGGRGKGAEKNKNKDKKHRDD
jgi:hypothetical protein